MAARPLFERALAIQEKVLGPEHPETAISRKNLALLFYGQDDLVAHPKPRTSPACARFWAPAVQSPEKRTNQRRETQGPGGPGALGLSGSWGRGRHAAGIVGPRHPSGPCHSNQR